MTLPTFSAGDSTNLSAKLNQIVEHIQGQVGSQDAYHFRLASGEDFIITLSDNDGVRKFVVRDSNGNDVFTVDSDGGSTLSGDTDLGDLTADSIIVADTLVFPTSASPAQTAAGSVVWDTVNDVLTIGDGSSRVTLTPSPEGTAVAATGVTDGHVLTAQGDGSAAWEALPTVTDTNAVLNALMNANRRVLGWALSQDADTGDPVGVGFVCFANNSGVIADGSDALASLDTGGTSGNDTQVVIFNACAPEDNPLIKMNGIAAPAGSGLTLWLFGMTDDPAAASAAGAYFRRQTTGNVFAVTDNGSSETTTDLGALNDGALRSWQVSTSDDGVTWVFSINGTTVATHTTNVPTAATVLDIAHNVTTAGSALTGSNTARFQDTIAICDRQS